jgi:phosphopantothenoylcysteine decarboxylase/phosphopantothenate--cysteine ligase
MNKNIIFGVTGSIAAFKAAEIVSRLKSQDFDITVIMTKSAQNFINPLTFRTLSQNKVITDIFIEDSMYDPQHISLADKADIIVIAPATANIIGKLASGIADDALTSIAMVIDAPLLIAPAMDDRMYLNPITQKNIKTLQDVGYKFIGPEKGRLASGRIGIGRMADVELITQSIVDELENTSDQKVDRLVRDSNAENKIKNKKEKRLRGPAITKIYESSSKRHGSVRSS